MEKNVRLIQQYLDTLAAMAPLTVHVVNASSRIVASTSSARTGEVVAPALAGEDRLALTENLWLILESEVESREIISNTIKAALESFLQTLEASNKSKFSQEEVIVRELLTRGYPKNDSTLLGYLKRAGLDVSQSRTVILMDFSEKVNRYFNINLDLGYEASAEDLKEYVVGKIKANRYLTKQDIVVLLNTNQIILIKAFLPVSDPSKMYQALDRICRSVLDDLEHSKIFSLRMAYGNLYTDFSKLKQSYEEAQSLIRLGAKFLNRNGLYTLDDLLVEQIAAALPPAAVDKILRPILFALKRKDGTSDVELLHVAEVFVDEGLNLVRTAQKTFLHRNTIAAKIEKIRELMGLDPESSFYHAFIIKLAAVYVRLSQPGMK